MSVRVVVADDQDLVRAGLRLVIGTQDDLEVVGEARDGREAVELARRLRPDVALLDIAMPVMTGLTAAGRVLALPEPPRVILLTTYDTDEHLEGALAAGVSGFLLKTSPPERLFAALRAAATGEALLDPAVTPRVIAGYAGRRAARPSLDGLTPRETDILRLVARGRTNAEIAAGLFITQATVGTHINRLLAKLSLRSRAQLVAHAYEAGLLRPGDDD
ncbi:response regulator transcription factor [Actinomadura sp. ATCC 31491]|uniref:Response regulator transcription factor n=1 Tax=Actinomadura luzonensis TaxID=2805427 RepID=A0ABT0FNA1_9ACTN|nr:response regulator transcription factor [Actinomadura luzonensis]MCK2213771.1 response regulator transcription factor [Actinomadura luzonensis]